MMARNQDVRVDNARKMRNSVVGDHDDDFAVQFLIGESGERNSAHR